VAVAVAVEVGVGVGVGVQAQEDQCHEDFFNDMFIIYFFVVHGEFAGT
jgi:hypothetical protein